MLAQMLLGLTLGLVGVPRQGYALVASTHVSAMRDLPGFHPDRAPLARGGLKLKMLEDLVNSHKVGVGARGESPAVPFDLPAHRDVPWALRLVTYLRTGPIVAGCPQPHMFVEWTS